MRRLTPAAALTAAFAGLYAAGALLRHARFRTEAFDLGIFDQAIWHLSRFETPASTIRGESNLLGDHFHPVLALAAPAFWVWDDVRALLVLQAMLVASSALPLYWTARRRLGERVAVLWSVAYALSAGLVTAVLFDFHEIAFAVPLISLACALVLARRFGVALVPVVALLLVKEDLALLVAAFGVVYLLSGRRRQGFALLAAGVASLVLLTKVVIPAFAGGRPYGYGDSVFGDGARDILTAVVREPWRLVTEAVSPVAKVKTVLALLAPFGILGVLSPLFVLLLPLLAVRLYSANPHVWSRDFHYDATAVPVVAFAAVDSVGRLRARGVLGPRLLAAVGIAVVAVAALGCASSARVRQVASPSFWTSSDAERGGRELVDRVPAGVAVIAHDLLAPHLSHRDRIWVLPIFPPGELLGVRPPFRARTSEAAVVAISLDLPLPHETPRSSLRRYVRGLQARGFRLAYSRGGWALYDRAAVPAVAPSPALRAFLAG